MGEDLLHAFTEGFRESSTAGLQGCPGHEHPGGGAREKRVGGDAMPDVKVACIAPSHTSLPRT